jgi:hypothetical protein
MDFAIKISYCQTPSSSFFIQMLIVAQLVKKISYTLSNPELVNLFTKASHLSGTLSGTDRPITVNIIFTTKQTEIIYW